MLLNCVLLLILRHAPEAMATDARPAQRTLTAPAAKTTRADVPRVRSSRAIASRRTSKQTRRSVRRSLPRMPRTAHPSASTARVLDPSRIHVIDGESFEYGGERFRIRGIDAIPLAVGWQRLDELLHQGPVTVVPIESDSFGWTVAEVLVNNHNLSDVLSRR
jgi:hypothetical protein